MGLSRDRAESALDGCADLGGFRRGALRSFLSALSDDQLIAMRIGDSASDDEIAGFLDRDEKISGEMIFCPCLSIIMMQLPHAPPCTPCTLHTPLTCTHCLALHLDVIACTLI